MKKSFLLLAAIGALTTQTASADLHNELPVVVEIGPHNKSLLPEGKEADGIIGDFVMTNDKVKLLISGNLPFRKANMGTFWGENNWTPGCLYDLTLKGSKNDQLTVWAPTTQQGPTSYVRIADVQEAGAVGMETVITAANNEGVHERHLYILKNGWSGLVVETTYTNESENDTKVSLTDTWTRFRQTGTFQGIHWADSIDPSHKCGYAYANISWKGSEQVSGSFTTIKPGQTLRFARFIAVGNSPLQAVGEVAEWLGDTGDFSGSIVGPAQDNITTATISIIQGEETIPLYPDENGFFFTKLKKGKYTLSISDRGRTGLKDFTWDQKGSFKKQFELGPATLAVFDIRNEKGESTPCKVMFKGIDGTPTPDLGPTDRAHGCKDQYHSAVGQFNVALEPGQYEITVVRGMEFSSITKKVNLLAGKVAKIEGTLKRVVKTPGWISADYHNHSTPSGDNTCGTDDRIINLAAEQIEFAPTTEHNRIYNWAPHIKKLGLSSEIKTVVGIELTGSGTHFNSFPLEEDRYAQDGGAPRWNRDPRITAATLENHNRYRKDRWIHINHPDMMFNFTDRDSDGRADGGFIGLGSIVDAIETQNFRTSYILEKSPYRIIEASGATPFERASGATFQINREFVWLQLLNQGFPVWGIAVADAHHVYGNGVGGWRTYIQSSTDVPSKIKWEEMSRNSKAGRMILTTGPYLEVETSDGTVAGGYTRGVGGIDIKVKVQCTDWIDIDRVQVLVNGRQIPQYNFTRKSNPDMFKDGVTKFDESISLNLGQDSHIIVVAMGENFDLSVGFGTSSQASIKPCAYNNPIFVDIDGGGFRPNGDNLGYALPTAGAKIEEIRALLKN